ncbi:M16 family metallopeptidase [Fimbriimonas ginsengisoli]|uniref:Peptidase M16 domain protein n=1 Tax=Fimbriimonas ginsengisoli Gsoil 348 TaxID=661478 RepID=A0A068NTH3_FIMGI|nr:pitrilysin family protein [Fimbriimonas ginsengisoli]AIE86853.1 peptidase M16 domain protein [Fimbriimonas ginsengisoli Gsoil 348]
MSDIQKFVLDNGVRVLVEPVGHVKSAAIGLWCRTGSRHEHESEAGITHLIEHMLFKGTERRTAKEIAESIEGRGGSLNAFTDKEATCYYCRVLADDVANGVDVLSDMMLHSLIDPDELKREQGVVLEEIKRSEDEPGDHVHDLHLHNRWGDHPLGRPIIGTPESVSSFTRENIKAYMDRRYRAENVLLSVAGNIDPQVVLDAARETLGKIPHTSQDAQPTRPSGTKRISLESKDVEQVHFCIGTDGTSIYDDDLYTMVVLDAALGGSMSSRIFQEIREKRGLVYSVGSYTLNYGAGGAYAVYGGTSLEQWPLVQELVRIEFDKVMASGLDDDELGRTKRNLSGNMVLALEGMSGRMMRMSRNELNHGRDIPIDETLTKINAVTNDAIVALANKILKEELVSTTAIGPFDEE